MGKLRKACKKHLGKKASREIPTYVGMFVTWFCIGFWHGGSWKYIFGSGLFFFAMIAGGMLLKPLFQRLTDALHIDTEARYWRYFQRLRTACLFTASVSFDRFVSFQAGLQAWKSALTAFDPRVLVDGTLLQLGLDGKNLLVCGGCLAAMLAVSLLQERVGSVRAWLAEKNTLLSAGVSVLLFLAVLKFGCYGPDYQAASFIYAGF